MIAHVQKYSCAFFALLQEDSSAQENVDSFSQSKTGDSPNSSRGQHLENVQLRISSNVVKHSNPCVHLLCVSPHTLEKIA